MPTKIFFQKLQPAGPVALPNPMATVNRAAPAKLPLENPTHRRYIPAIQFELLAAQENNNPTSNRSPSTVSDQRQYTGVSSDEDGTSSFETDRESTSSKSSSNVWGKFKRSFKSFRNNLNSKNVEATSQLSDIQPPIAQIPVPINPQLNGNRRASTSSAESAPTRTYRSAGTVPQQANARAYLRRRNSAPGVLEQGTPQNKFPVTAHSSDQSTSAAIDPPMQPYVALKHPSFDFEEESGENATKWGESTLEAIVKVPEKYRTKND